jgi:hypothetical protein
MVEMGVRQDNVIDRFRWDGKFLPVQIAQILEPLEQAAIDEDAMVLMGEQMFRSCDGSGRTERFQREHLRPFRDFDCKRIPRAGV